MAFHRAALLEKGKSGQTGERAGRSFSSTGVRLPITNTVEPISHCNERFKVDQKKGRDFFLTMEIQNSAAAVENLLSTATSLGLATVGLGILDMVKDDILWFLEESAEHLEIE